MKKQVKKEQKMQRPKFMIFTDKDGTLNLEDKELNNILTLISVMGGMVIPITGRTVGDIQEDMKKKKVRMPEIIIGDNGATIYSTVTNEFLIKRTLEHDKVMEIVDDFIKNGGKSEFIRYTDGSTIYASDSKDVRDYYKHSKTAVFCEDIYESIKQSPDINKVTLAGSEEEMTQSAECASELDFWTDMDKTKFPRKEYSNYRLDVSQKNINKGEAVRRNCYTIKAKIWIYMCRKW